MAVARPGANIASLNQRRAMHAMLRATTALCGVPRIKTLVGAALVAALCALPAQAEDWTGAVSNDWFVNGNWLGGSTPTAADVANIDTTSPNPTIIYAAPGTANSVIVGHTDDGVLSIQGGGSLSDQMALIGRDSGSTGAATVTGAGSKWTNTGGFFDGYDGTGALTIEEGGAVSDTDGSIGAGSHSTGWAKVTGTGSTWTNSSEFYVGADGTGVLNVEKGGAVSDKDGLVGGNAGSTGTATVTGTGSTWTSSDALIVGNEGNGKLTVENGGTITDHDSGIGFKASSTGNATITGAGSQWTNTNGLLVGVYGKGDVTIKSGGSISDVVGLVGDLAGSTGTAIVTGTGSKWMNSDALVVGNKGNGKLTVEDGGTITDHDGGIGFKAGAIGNATITGAGSVWTSSDEFVVGGYGAGTLNIEEGGAVSDKHGYIGLQAGSTGMATVNGAGSTWVNSSGFVVGGYGTGTLNIENGGAVSDDVGGIGGAAGSTGTTMVAGAGSIWTSSDEFAVGRYGTGTLNIEKGGTVGDKDGIVGFQAGSTGTATVNGTGSTWASSGSLTVGMQGAATLTVANGGVVVAGAGINLAGLGGSLGTLNIGAAAGDAPVAPGTLATPQLTFGAGAGALVFNHTSSAYSFAPAISGSGAVDALAGTTLLTGASGGFTGTATVHGGATLGIDGTLGGTLDVLAGGRLEGTGTAGIVTVAGTIAPGHSIGTLHVSGNYTQAAGSTYEVELNSAGNSDLIDVAGTATLNGGMVDVLPLPDFALATPYTILTAAGGVTGTFAGISGIASSAFLSPKLTYDPNDAYLTVAQSASFASAALTPNQKAAATGADSTGPGNPVWNAIALLPSASDAPVAFDAISGEIHASVKTGLIDDSRFIRDAVIGRLRGTIAGDPGVAPASNGKGNRLPAPASDRFGLWAHGFGSWGRWDGDGNAATLDRTIGGVFIGGDAAVADDWRLGLAAGYSRSSFDVDGRASSADVDSYTIAAYGGGHVGGFGLRFGAANTWHSIDTGRLIMFPGFADTANASYDARTAQIFGDVGYTIRAGRASFEPFADLAYVNLHTDGYSESGSAGLTAGSDNTDVTYMTLGLRAATSFALGGVAAKVHGTLGWRHAFGDTTPFATQSFAGGTAFTVAGVPIAKDAAVVKAGLDFNLSPSATLSLSYAGQIGNGTTDQGGNATFSVRF